jgi:hypothetical protein
MNKQNITYRKASYNDVEAIAELAIKSVSKNPWPVVINEKMINRVIENAINPQDIVLVAVQDGVVVGAVVGISNYAAWHYGMVLEIALYYSEVPGVTATLIRMATDWAKQNEDIKVIFCILEEESTAATKNMFTKAGYDRKSTSVSIVKE